MSRGVRERTAPALMVYIGFRIDADAGLDVVGGCGGVVDGGGADEDVGLDEAISEDGPDEADTDAYPRRLRVA